MTNKINVLSLKRSKKSKEVFYGNSKSGFEEQRQKGQSDITVGCCPQWLRRQHLQSSATVTASPTHLYFEERRKVQEEIKRKTSSKTAPACVGAFLLDSQTLDKIAIICYTCLVNKFHLGTDLTESRVNMSQNPCDMFTII